MTPPVRYAVVGTGWFAQTAVLPGFANANNSKLSLIVSGDSVKRQELAEKYKVEACSYEEFPEALKSDVFDAVYIVLPNSLHAGFALSAAAFGKHVLCEKPLTANAAEARQLVDQCAVAGVKLMTAYRLHFESGNLAAIDAIESGRIGDPRLFSSLNCQQITEGNSRLVANLGGSPLLDMGIYCINAARYLFRDEPMEVMAFSVSNGETRFSEVPEMVSAIMRFPKERLAMFTCGFGEAKVSEYRVVGTTGDLQMEPAYVFDDDIRMNLTANGKSSVTRFRRRDQVGAEILYFSDCVLTNRDPEPDGYEGLVDMIIIDALEQSMSNGRSVVLEPFRPKVRPNPSQEIRLPRRRTPRLVNAAAPSR